jgi:hypothetical protein
VAPRVEFDAVFTTAADFPAGALALEVGGVLAWEEEEPEELLPQAARVNDAMRAGRRNFRVTGIGLLWLSGRVDAGGPAM